MGAGGERSFVLATHGQGGTLLSGYRLPATGSRLSALDSPSDLSRLSALDSPSDLSR